MRRQTSPLPADESPLDGVFEHLGKLLGQAGLAMELRLLAPVL